MINRVSHTGILAALLLTAFSTVSLAESTWTLEDCLKQAKKSSLKLESAKLREQAADISVKQAKSGNSPTVSASIQNTLYDHPFINNEDHYRLNLGISGSYTLWDGGATSLNVESKTLSKEERKAIEKLRESENFQGDTVTKKSIFDKFKNYFS